MLRTRRTRLAVVAVAPLLLSGCTTVALLEVGQLQDHVVVERVARRIDGRLYVPLTLTTRRGRDRPVLGTRRIWMEVDVEGTLRGRARPVEHADDDVPDLTRAEMVPVARVEVADFERTAFERKALDGSPACTAVLEQTCHRLYLAATPDAKPPCRKEHATGAIISPPRSGLLGLVAGIATGRGMCVRRRHELWSYPILAVGLPVTVTFDVVTTPVWLTTLAIFVSGMAE